jgi:hypothetical protein
VEECAEVEDKNKKVVKEIGERVEGNEEKHRRKKSEMDLNCEQKRREKRNAVLTEIENQQLSTTSDIKISHNFFKTEAKQPTQ